MIHDDMRTLMEALNSLATHFLEEVNSFPPSGATLDLGGELSLVKPYDGVGHEEPEQQIELLEAAFRESAAKGEARACALALDVMANDPRTGEPIEAILVSAEVKGAGAMDLFTPYKRDGELELGKPFATPREPRVFTEA